jgi:ribosomal protein S18 acetylase RimI-like enzyme
MSEVEARARLLANHLYLLVTRDNVNARRFYERLGLRSVGELPALVQPDLDEVLYHKRLRSHTERLDT